MGFMNGIIWQGCLKPYGTIFSDAVYCYCKYSLASCLQNNVPLHLVPGFCDVLLNV